MNRRVLPLIIGSLLLALGCGGKDAPTGPSIATLVVTTTSLPNAGPAVAYSQTLMATGGDGSYTWSLTVGSLPTGLSLNTSSGDITGTLTGASSTFTVQVASGDGQTDTQALSITVNAPLAVTTTTLPDGLQNENYGTVPLTATGAGGDYAWSVAVGLLPTGLSLAAGGDITGTPRVAQTGNFTVQVASGDGQTATQELAVTVGPCVPTFEDAALEAAVRAALFVGATFDLTCALLSELTGLTAQSFGITSLVGIQNLTGLTSLDVGGFVTLSGNLISDIRPLSGLTNLTDLRLNNTGNITDLSPLSGLTGLTQLHIRNNSISDLSPLSGLTSLEGLNLAANSFSDVSALSGLTNLTFLAINSNGNVTDIGALSGMTTMTLLWIGDNPISDISALSGMTSLESLHAFDNLITDVSALEGIASFTLVDLLRNSNLSNIQPLIDNTGLGSGDRVVLSDTSVNCTDVALLRAKGVAVTSDCP